MNNLLKSIENLENLLISFKATIISKNVNDINCEIDKTIWKAHKLIREELKTIVLKEDKYEN